MKGVFRKVRWLRCTYNCWLCQWSNTARRHEKYMSDIKTGFNTDSPGFPPVRWKRCWVEVLWGGYLFSITTIWWFIIAHARNSTPVDAIICFIFIFFFLLKKLVGYDSKCGHVVFNPLIITAILVYIKGMGGRGWSDCQCTF